MYIDKNDRRFITYVRKKNKLHFDSIDDYLFWLYQNCNQCKKLYYQKLEEEIILYSNLQTGKEN